TSTLAWLKARGTVCVCASDPNQKQRDLDVLVGGASDEALPAPGAWPVGVTPPRRFNAPPAPNPEERDAAMRAAGIDPAYLEHAPVLRRLVLGSAVAMGQGRITDALRMQREAVQLSERIRMPQVMVICQITLASYLSAAGKRAQALRELEAATATAAQ